MLTPPLTSLMEALRTAWHAVQRHRGAGPVPVRSVVREAVHLIGLVLYTVVAVNALILLELMPSLGPSAPSVTTTARSPTFPAESPRPARSRQTRRIRKRSTDLPPLLPRLALPAAPAAPATASLLTRLPLELRQEIYRHVLAGRHKQFIRLGSDDAPHVADFRLAGTPYRTRDSFVAAPWSARGSAARKSRLLALPLVCRQVYEESIELLYQGVVFKACRLVTLADLQRALAPPNHLAHVRELELAYEFRCGLPLRRSVALVEDADWETAWSVIAHGMPGLRRLRVDLFAFDVLPLVQPDDDQLVLPVDDAARWRWLRSMLMPRGLKTAHLKLHYIKRLNDVPWERPTRPLRWYMMVVMEALERLIEASWMGKRLDPAAPPFNMPKDGGQGLVQLWETCCRMQQDMKCYDPVLKL